jgi:putative SOS response-associated peptidase YedK
VPQLVLPDYGAAYYAPVLKPSSHTDKTSPGILISHSPTGVQGNAVPMGKQEPGPQHYISMCGHFTLRSTRKELAEHFGLEFPDIPPLYNIAPTQEVIAIRAAGVGRELIHLRWGLIPSWAKDQRVGTELINARAETVADKPSFRSPFKSRRCLIRADGFYEWRKAGSQKQPYHITLRNKGPFAFAGLWERWHGDEGDIWSCSIITIEANELMLPLHDRMPVILPTKYYATWLDPAPRSKEDLLSLLKPFPSEAMPAVPVSTTVNNPRNR